MNEDFVCFELAKKLKEKGFNKRVCGYYWETGGLSICNTPTNSNALENEFSAPTIPQVLKWLRDEKNIFVVVLIDDDSDCPVTYNIFNGADCVYHHHEEYFELSEWSKCEMSGIEYVIDNLI